MSEATCMQVWENCHPFTNFHQSCIIVFRNLSNSHQTKVHMNIWPPKAYTSSNSFWKYLLILSFPHNHHLPFSLLRHLLVSSLVWKNLVFRAIQSSLDFFLAMISCLAFKTLSSSSTLNWRFLPSPTPNWSCCKSLSSTLILLLTFSKLDMFQSVRALVVQRKCLSIWWAFIPPQRFWIQASSPTHFQESSSIQVLKNLKGLCRDLVFTIYYLLYSKREKERVNCAQEKCRQHSPFGAIFFPPKY